MTPDHLRRAVEAALDKKAEDVVLLDLREATSLTDYFLIASGTNQRQLLAVADAIREALREDGWRPRHVEGYPRHEWILMDYDAFVVHVFTERSRRFYDIERLWSEAKRAEFAP